MRGVSTSMLLTFVSYLMVACANVPDEKGDDTAATSDTPPDAQTDTGQLDAEQPSISVRSQFHYGNWGNETPSCNIEISISAQQQPDPTPPKEDTGGHSEPQIIEIPTDPGTCILSSFEKDTGEPAPPTTGDPITAGDYAYLYGEDEDFVLVVDEFQLENGRAVYTMESCSYENYPFESVFDFELPDEKGSFSGMYIEDLVYVGPNLAVYDPEVKDGNQFLEFTQEDSFYTEWAILGKPQKINGKSTTFSNNVVIRNTRSRDEFIFEALACLPETETTNFTFGPDQWYALEPNHSTTEVPNYSTFQIDAQFQLPTLPDGTNQLNLMPSVVSYSGMFHLYAAGADL